MGTVAQGFAKSVCYCTIHRQREGISHLYVFEDRERRICELRFVKGKTTPETADELNITLDAFNKMQKRVFQKLYLWLVLRFENQITRNVQMTKIDIVKMLIKNDEELSALLFCEDENISYSTFKKLLRELKPTSKLLA